MGKMVGGLGLMVLVVLVASPVDAIWSGVRKPEPAMAGEAAREYAKEAVRNTADAAVNVGESVRQTAKAAYETTASAARTVTGGWSDRGSADRPTGAAYRDRAGNYVADTATATQRRAADAAAAVRNTAAGTAQAARDTAARAYDATVDTVGSTRDKVWGAPEPEPTITQRAADAARRASDNVRDGASRAYDTTADTVSSARGKVWGAPEPEPTITERAADAARRASENVRDGASRAYEATADTVGSARDKVWGAPEPEPTITQRAADAARRASDNVRDGASRAYDTTTGGWNEDNRGMYDKARDSVSRAGQATRDTTYGAMGYEAPTEKSYASRAYDSVVGSSSDAYESGKNRLGSIIEILGWQRVDDTPTTSHLGRYSSPYDVVVGNTRYVWHQKPEAPQSYYESAKNTVGSATQTVADKAREGTNTVYGVAERTKDATVDTASRATESVKNVAGKTGETVSEYSQKSRDAINTKAAAVEQKLAKPGLFRRLWRLLHLLTWGVTFGTAVWMTFMSGRVLQQNMPREQFRTVQTKLFPSYLRFLTAGEGVLTFLYLLSSRSSWWQLLKLLLVSGATAYNAYVLEPQTTKLYTDRLRLEKEEGRGLSDVAESKVTDELAEKNKKFKELHGYSASLNLLSLAGLTYHAWHIVSRLHA